jgi:hypothetical protein
LKWNAGRGCAPVSKPREFLARVFNARAQVAAPAERRGRAILTGHVGTLSTSWPLAPEGESSMNKFQSFAFVASALGAALMTGAGSAQTAAPAPAASAPAANAPLAAAPAAKPKKKSQMKPQKKVTPSLVVVVTNSRSVALSELDATPSGETLPKTIVSNLAPGKKISVTITTVKSCVFNLHGAYADGLGTDSTSVDLCKDKNVNLVE